MIQQIRNECLNLIRLGNRKINEVRFSKSETQAHISKKVEICCKLTKQEKHFITEGIFKDGSGRCDILILDDFKVVEIVCSEKEESIIRKKQDYPNGLKIEVVRA